MQPFGKGLITVVVPQLRRGENSLFLWSLDDTRQPMHTFVGHTDVVLEFQWRQQDEGEKPTIPLKKYIPSYVIKVRDFNLNCRSRNKNHGSYCSPLYGQGY